MIKTLGTLGVVFVVYYLYVVFAGSQRQKQNDPVVISDKKDAIVGVLTSGNSSDQQKAMIATELDSTPPADVHDIHDFVVEGKRNRKLNEKVKKFLSKFKRK